MRVEHDRGRVVAAIAAALIQLLIGYALIVGLRVQMPVRLAEGLQIFEVAADPPVLPTVVPHRARARRPAGRAAPPALRAHAAAIVAPPPLIAPEVPPPVLAALTAGAGSDAHAGAAPDPGPGSGAGGAGTGTGSGSDGSGDGDGDGTPARLLRGQIRDADYPRAAYRAGVGGTVYLRFVVGTNGRITECSVTRSSGNAELDATTCRLLIERRRYAPARDAHGRKVPDVWTGDHVWSVVPRAPVALPGD